MPIRASDIVDYVTLGREQRGVEFKAAGPRTDKYLRGKVLRAMLSMSNRRDGGVVLVGVREIATVPTLAGLSAGDAETWRFDHLAESVANHADPRLAFDSYTVEVNGNTVLVIEVREFSDVPVLCKNELRANDEMILRKGALYVRSHGRPESREVANYDEMREVLELATDKEVRRFVTRAQQAGLMLNAPDTVTAIDRYAIERGDL